MSWAREMDMAIETRGLTKRYGAKTVVDSLSLRLGLGEVYGFVGLNGAGKTTTIRMLLGMVRPTDGDAYILGTRVHAGVRDVWSEVGYLVETPSAYGDRTATDLLASPTSRGAVVGAKFIVAAVWSAVLAAMVYGLGVAVGSAVGLPGWSADLAMQASGRVMMTAGLTILLATPFAFMASAGRGYLPPVGLMFLLLFLAQILAALGWGDYFPWSVPALSSGVAGPHAQSLGPVSYLIVGLTGSAGLASTFAWWRFADLT